MKLKDDYMKLLMVGVFILALPFFLPAVDAFAVTAAGQAMASPSVTAPNMTPYVLARTVEAGGTRGGSTEGEVPGGSNGGGISKGGNGTGIESGSGAGSGQGPADPGPVRQRCPNCPRN